MNFELLNSDKTEEIQELFTSVFSDSEGIDEGKLIGKLVSDLLKTTDKKELFIFICQENNKIIGSIIFSYLKFKTDLNAFILSPVAVATDFQKQGIGQKLILFGIDHLKKKNIDYIFTYGDPNYYSKVGFKQVSHKKIIPPFKLEYPEGLLGQSLGKEAVESINGSFECVAALSKKEYW